MLRNGSYRDARRPSRTMRFDHSGSNPGGGSPGAQHPGAPLAMQPHEGHSGRRLVVVAAVVILLSWGILYLAFRGWRANYRERVAYGVSHVVSTIEPLRAITPPRVEPRAWADALDKTRAMLTTVVSSNVLDVDEMNKLKAELEESVAQTLARPESATDDLARIWNSMSDRAEFLFQDSRSPDHLRHPRPAILPSRPEKGKASATAG
jgi:hypothetical protein